MTLEKESTQNPSQALPENSSTGARITVRLLHRERGQREKSKNGGPHLAPVQLKFWDPFLSKYRHTEGLSYHPQPMWSFFTFIPSSCLMIGISQVLSKRLLDYVFNSPSNTKVGQMFHILSLLSSLLNCFTSIR